mgnify:CR=1 FL=1
MWIKSFPIHRFPCDNFEHFIKNNHTFILFILTYLIIIFNILSINIENNIKLLFLYSQNPHIIVFLL